MSGFRKLLAITGCLIIVSGCSSYTDMDEYNEVDAIYWHEGSRYSYAMNIDGEVIIERIPTNHQKPRLFVDVNKNDKPWYRCKWRYSRNLGNKDTLCEIHIKSIDSLKTSGWNHGKFGSGQTIRIN